MNWMTERSALQVFNRPLDSMSSNPDDANRSLGLAMSAPDFVIAGEDNIDFSTAPTAGGHSSRRLMDY